MLVKCVDLSGEKRPREESFKAPNKKYYSSEEAYLALKEEDDWRRRCTAKMQDILNYQYDMKLPTRWYKYLNEQKSYGFEVIYDTIEACEKNFQWALQNKDFKNDACALSYFIAIIQNNAMEQYRKKVAREKEILQSKIDEFKSEQYFDMAVGRDSVKGKDLSSLIGIV